jgi:hypothetical protein
LTRRYPAGFSAPTVIDEISYFSISPLASYFFLNFLSPLHHHQVVGAFMPLSAHADDYRLVIFEVSIDVFEFLKFRSAQSKTSGIPKSPLLSPFNALAHIRALGGADLLAAAPLKNHGVGTR